jgi:hypothetical protein
MLISKTHKIDIAMIGQTINNSNVTGPYFKAGAFRTVLAKLSVGAMAATKTAKIEILQASDADGTGAKGIPSTAAQAATAEITANTKVTALTLTLATVLAAQTVTINGLVFTAHANTTTASKREFKIDGDDTADAAALAGLINDVTYGVPGVKATAALGVITLVASPAGDATITASASDTTVTIATTQAQAYVEFNENQLDKANGFIYYAVKVTSSANGVCSAEFIRNQARFSPDQKVGASAVV